MNEQNEKKPFDSSRVENIIWVLLQGSAHGIGLYLLFHTITRVGLVVNEVLSDFGMAVPVLTQYLIDFGASPSHYLAASGIILFIDLAILGTLRLVVKINLLATTWALLVWVGIAYAFVWVIIAFVNPLVMLIHSVF